MTLLATSALPARAQPAPTTVRLGTFVRTLPLLAAEAQGFWAGHGLAVEYLQVSSSTQQFQSLRDGGYDMVLSSPDNVLNYRFNQDTPLGAPLDAQIIAGADYGMRMALLARPGITSVADLRGKAIGVDSPSSGFAYVIYDMLAAEGLQPGRDYTVVIAGGMLGRFNRLLSGQLDATLLSYGFDLRAADAGYPVLRTVEQVADPYLGQAFAAREAWLAQNDDTAVRFLQAYNQALAWSLAPDHREEAIGLLLPTVNNDRAIAEELYAIQTAPGIGLVLDAAIKRAPLKSVVELRQRYGGFERASSADYLASPGSGLYSLAYLNQARQRHLAQRQP